MKGTTEEIKALLTQAINALDKGQKSVAETRLDELLAHELDLLTAGEVIERANTLKQKIQRRRNLIRNTRLIAITVLVNAVLIGSLIATPVSSVAIDGTIDTQRMKFVIEQDADFTLPPANSAVLSSFESLEIDALILDDNCKNISGCPEIPVNNFIETSGSDVNFTIDGDSINFEYITIHPGTDLELIVSEGGRKELVFKTRTGRFEGEMAINDSFTIDCDSFAQDYALCDPGKLLEQSGGIILNADGNSRITLFLLDKLEPERVSENVSVSSVAFETRELRGKRASTINQGSVRLLSYANDPVKLQQGDFLTIAPKDTFKVMQILVGDSIKLRITGDAKTLVLNNRQLKPSLLEWLREHSKISLFIGVLLSLTSFVLPILQRTNILRES